MPPVPPERTATSALREPLDLLAPLAREERVDLPAPPDSRDCPDPRVPSVRPASPESRVSPARLEPQDLLVPEATEVSAVSAVPPVPSAPPVPVVLPVLLETMVPRETPVPPETPVPRAPLDCRECPVSAVLLAFLDSRETEVTKVAREPTVPPVRMELLV